MFWDGTGANSCWHGVTSAVMGNCGFTLAPVRCRAAPARGPQPGARRGHRPGRVGRRHRLELRDVPRVPRRRRPDPEGHQLRRQRRPLGVAHLGHGGARVRGGGERGRPRPHDETAGRGDPRPAPSGSPRHARSTTRRPTAARWRRAWPRGTRWPRWWGSWARSAAASSRPPTAPCPLPTPTSAGRPCSALPSWPPPRRSRSRSGSWPRARPATSSTSSTTRPTSAPASIAQTHCRGHLGPALAAVATAVRPAARLGAPAGPVRRRAAAGARRPGRARALRRRGRARRLRRVHRSGSAGTTARLRGHPGLRARPAPQPVGGRRRPGARRAPGRGDDRPLRGLARRAALHPAEPLPPGRSGAVASAAPQAGGDDLLRLGCAPEPDRRLVDPHATCSGTGCATARRSHSRRRCAW